MLRIQSRGGNYKFWKSPISLALVSLILFFVTMASWSYSEPLMAGPDEPAHLIHAYGLDHGQMGTPLIPKSNVSVDYRVPYSLYFASTEGFCWHFKPDQPASCSLKWQTAPITVSVTNYVAHYPPEYYAFVGLGSYVSTSSGGIYFMRLLSDLLSALALSASVYVIAAYAHRRSLIFGLIFSMTPMAFFLSSVINPSGFEITMAISLWTTLLIIALDHRRNVPRGLVTTSAIQSVLFVMIRGLSPLWFAITLLVFVVLMGTDAFGELLQRRDARIGTAAVCLATAQAVWWTISQGTLNVLPVGFKVDPKDSFANDLRATLHHVPEWVHQFVGLLGWLDTEMPDYLYRSWDWLVLLVLLFALLRGSWAQRSALVLIGILAFWVPIFIITHQADQLGVVWQTRDGMPLLVGVTLLASALLTKSIRTHVVVKILLSGGVFVVGFFDVVALYTNLKRYAVGANGPSNFYLHTGSWTPPPGYLAVLITISVATFALATFMTLWLWKFQPVVKEAPAPEEPLPVLELRKTFHA